MRHARGGFTLVEVMVALAIVAVALPALLTTLYRQADDTAYLRDKSVAQMVAANRLAEMRLVLRATRRLAAGEGSGQDSLAERDWYWWQRTTATEVPDFFRVEIRVADDEERRERPLYTLVAFLSADLRVDDTPLQGGGPGDPAGDLQGTEGNGETQLPDGLSPSPGADTGLNLPLGVPQAVEGFVD